MKSIKNIHFILLCIIGYQYNNICAEEKTKPTTIVQNKANINNDTQILKKLALIDKQDSDDNKAIQERSYNSLFNNIINFKKFIVDTFTKKQFQDFFNHLVNQIYPEDTNDIIDFGKPIEIEKKSEPAKQDSTTPTPPATPAPTPAATDTTPVIAAPVDTTTVVAAPDTTAAPVTAVDTTGTPDPNGTIAVS